MEYSENDFLTPSLKTELENIKTYFDYINEFINQYETKNKKIDEKILSLSGNNYLDDNSSLELLKYQKNIIKNEKQYLDNLNNIFKTELNKQIYMVSEKSIIMFMSLQSINKEINKDFNVTKQLRRSFDKNDYVKIINDTIDNFTNIKTLLLNLKKYNIDLNKDLENNNFHCKTLNHNINQKRVLIYINYKKLYETFITIIDYFSQHSKNLIEKLEKDSNFKFLVNIGDSTNTIDTITNEIIDGETMEPIN